MQGFLLRGESEGPVHIFYGAVVDFMRVGVGANMTTGETFPSIELIYPPECHLTMLAIAREMERMKLYPEVFIKEEAGIAYVAVHFLIQPATKEFIQEIFPSTLPRRALEYAGQGNVLLHASGEAEFPSGEIASFRDLYKKSGFFNVYLVEEREAKRNVACGVRLPTFQTDLPFPLPEA